MPPDEVCSRCGSRMVAGSCPACGNSSAELKAPRQPKARPQQIVAVIVGAITMGQLLLFLFLAIYHRHPAQGAQRNTAAQPQWPRHEGPIAKLNELHGHGTIYLVQFTPHTAAYSADDLAQWLHTRYGLEARSLRPVPLPKSAWNLWRRQYLAEELYEEIRRANPAVAADPNAYLIGLIDADMYSAANDWSASFTQRDGWRTAIISSAELVDRPSWWERSSDEAAARANLQARIWRVLLKDVAILYWGLPVNNDPTSLLHQPEDPDLPTEDIYESDLDPARTRWGQLEGEPCLYLWYSAKTGLQVLPSHLISSCSIPTPQPNDSTELFEVDLRLGIMIDRRTDDWIPGARPIAFERALRPGWKGVNPFGVSGTDSFDSFLASADNIYVSVVGDDAGSLQLVRDPIWLSYLPLTKYVDTEYAGRLYEMRWRTSPYPHYDLRRYDGQTAWFLPCDTPRPTYCYLNDVKDTDGYELKFQRGADRRLLQLTSSAGGWLKLRYGTEPRIEELDDSRGQTVRYGYNERNQLTSVTYSSGETLSFAYDDANELTAFSASPDTRTKPKVLLRCEYQQGLIRSQTLADGSKYVYSYGPFDKWQTRSATVETPNGSVYTIRRYGSSSLVWETDAAREKSAASIQRPSAR